MIIRLNIYMYKWPYIDWLRVSLIELIGCFWIGDLIVFIF